MRETAADSAALAEFQAYSGTSASDDDAAGLLRGMADLVELAMGGLTKSPDARSLAPRT
jgi:hypothetical protein